MIRRWELPVLVGVWVLSAIWVWVQLDQGWVAHDDGAFAQSAARVLDGQLPHREFAELYTGGLTFLNAATFLVFGEDLVALRYPLFAAFIGLVPATYYVARHVTGPVTSTLVTVVVVTWSIPVYPAAVPSWYLLIFSVYGAAALVRWRVTGRDRWLLLAGVVAGAEICFKIVGVYFVAAAFLFLLVACRVGKRTRVRGVDLASVGAALAVAGLVGSVLGSRLGAPELVNFVIPTACVTIAALVDRHRRLQSRTADDAPSFLRSAGIFIGGSATPLLVLAVPYIASGSVRDLVEGVFVSPQARRDVVYLATPGPKYLVLALLLVGAYLVRSSGGSRRRNLVAVGLAALALTLVLVAAVDRTAYAVVWVTAQGLAPVVVVVGSAIFILGRTHGDRRRWEFAFMLAALVAFVGLVQFPFGAGIYFLYVAPLVGLAAVAVAGRSRTHDDPLTVALAAACALFGAAYLDRASLADLGWEFGRDGQSEVLDADRASIRVYPGHAERLREIVRIVRAHSGPGAIYAGPDFPELYFLADRENPTRSLFDFLDTSGSARGQALLRTLRNEGVTAVAINRTPAFSKPLAPTTVRALEALYPNVIRLGAIDVRWTERPPRIPAAQ